MIPYVLKVNEVAQLLRVSTETVYRLAQKGELRGRKIGRIWRFLQSDVSAFLGEDTKKCKNSDSTVPPENSNHQSNQKRVTN